jgi:pimeloyl-ACP methyl ester carboxylesterase
VRIPTTDGLELAVHDLGGHGPTLLLSHATGFHGMVWQPMARHLTAHYRAVTFDYRGHGDSDRPGGDTVHWQGYVDDAIAVVDALPGLGLGTPRFAVGHSMGGAALLMAEVARPGTFTAIVLYEPIVFPPEMRADRGPVDSAIAAGARRRRAVFDSFGEAVANYSAKPPLDCFTPEAMTAYVEHGFGPTADGKVRLKCEPEHEARTFEGNDTILVWNELDAVRCPVLVLGGSLADAGPSAMAEPVARRLPKGSFHRFEELGHLGPMQDPPVVAAAVAAFLAVHGGPASGSATL